MEEKKDTLDLAGELEKLIEKFGEIVEAQESEIVTLRSENEELLKIIRKNHLIFDILIDSGYLGRVPNDLTRVEAV